MDSIRKGIPKGFYGPKKSNHPPTSPVLLEIDSSQDKLGAVRKKRNKDFSNDLKRIFNDYE